VYRPCIASKVAEIRTANIQAKVIAFAITFTYRNTGRCLIIAKDI
jgi:hypothetical protein